MTNNFADRVIDATRDKKTPLCCGIDPHIDMLPPLFRSKNKNASIDSVTDFCHEILDRCKGKIPAIKPQSAMFERFGPKGTTLLAELAQAAITQEILVITDAKRGDIGSTSAAYAQAFLGHAAPFPSDALTINPFLGLDTLAPFIDHAQATESGLFVLVRTSNPGAGDIQDLKAHDGRPVFHHLAGRLRPLIEQAEGTHGFSSIGIVAGASYPEDAALLRRLLPSALFLVPGFGAQGGGAKQALAGFIQAPNGRLEGGLVNASRSLCFPASAHDAPDLSTWRTAIDAAIDNAIAALKD